MQAESWVPIENLRFLDRFLEGLAYWETEEEFREAFYAAYALELKCAADGHSGVVQHYIIGTGDNYYVFKSAVWNVYICTETGKRH